MSDTDDPLANLLRTARARRAAGGAPAPALPAEAPETPPAPAPPPDAPQPLAANQDSALRAPPAARQDSAILPLRGATPPQSAMGERRGLSPLDLLTLPPAQQRVANWLARRGQVPLRAIREGLGAELPDVEAVLDQLKNRGYVQQSWVDGALYYRVVFSGTVRRGASRVPTSIWSRLEMDNTTFLREVPLFRKLSDEQLRDLDARLEARHYHRNEVILWQGAAGEYVYLIKAGVVGISRISPQTQNTHILAYLKEGDILGEYGALAEQGRAASATATALSEVDMLIMKHADFLALLEQYNTVAIELARMLVGRIQATSERSAGQQHDSRVCLMFNLSLGAEGTRLGSTLAMALARSSDSAAVYTEYPHARSLPARFGFTPGAEIYQHPGGFQIFAGAADGDLPATVRATLLLDQLTSRYRAVVIGVPAAVDEATRYMIEQADQIVIVTAPDREVRQQLDALGDLLRSLIHPERTQLAIILNHGKAPPDAAPGGAADFEIPPLDDLPPLAEQTLETLPPPLVGTMTELAKRLGHSKQIGIYIPTTLDVDQAADTSAWVDRTLAFLGTLFGGATSNQAQGVWSSERSGLVNETIYIVRTYTSQTDLDRHLPNVLTYVERLKDEMKQEAMALEVNQKLLIV